MTTHDFRYFTLYYHPATGEVTIIYPDGAQSTVSPNSEDERHGAALGVSPGEHKLLHEITHSVVAIAQGRIYCPIVWAHTHGQPMPDNAQEIEDMVFALSYFCFQVPMEYPDKWAALGKLAQVRDPWLLRQWVLRIYERMTSQ